MNLDVRCYEAKIEESEKGRQPPGVGHIIAYLCKPSASFSVKGASTASQDQSNQHFKSDDNY